MSNTPRIFRDRCQAGRVLALDLARHLQRRRYLETPRNLERPRYLERDGHGNLLVLGLARGGVPIGAQVASFLQAPLDVCLVRKLGVPQWPELAMGAVTTGGGVVLNDNLIDSLGIGDDQIRDVVARETAELRRREQAYRAERGPLVVAGRTVVLVDDGIATGASMTAAARWARQAGATQIVVGVPVGPTSVCRQLIKDADGVVCSTMPADFHAVGQAFEDFHQVSDDEVRAALADAISADGGAANKNR